jgi:Fe-S oxidoreductase
VIHFINKKMPGNLPKKTARALLDIEDNEIVPIIRNPKTTTAETEAVFYFPGCGSERLFSQVGLATQAMLWHVGVQTVLPPGYLCCGYPQRGAGQYDKAEKMVTDNRVLFHRVANTLNYLDIKTVVVSCGTCYDQLPATNSTRSSRAAASSTSTSTCWRRASSSKASPARATCTTTPATRRSRPWTRPSWSTT